MDNKFGDRFSDNNLPHLLDKALKNSQQAERKAQLESRIDSLTEVGNLRALDEELIEAIERLNSEDHKRGSDPDYIVFLFFDLNKFKFFNDKYGHPTGNEALKIVAERLKSETAKRGGRGVRSGGDEVVIL